jgi:hypothetical protein
MVAYRETNALAPQGLHQPGPPLPGVVPSDPDVVRLEDLVPVHAGQ